MEQQITSLLATFKTTTDYGIKYAATYPPGSVAATQFALIAAAVPKAGTLGAAQVSGIEAEDSAVIAKVADRLHLRQDMLAITDAVHSLILLGTAGLEGKFHMPHSNGDQALLNTARAFATDAVAISAALISLGLPTDFIAHLNADIGALEQDLKTKGEGKGAHGSAVGALGDTTHKAAIALHVLNTIVRNANRNNPAGLAEWAIASHVLKHTPVPRA